MWTKCITIMQGARPSKCIWSWDCREADEIPREDLEVLHHPDGTPLILGNGMSGQVCSSCCQIMILHVYLCSLHQPL